MNAARRGKTLSVSLFRIRGGVREFSSAYVPKSRDMTEHDGEILINFLQRNNSITCLTGAGISTESGIPDYRSKGVGLYDRENHKPILHQEFMRSEVHRNRYWARNYVGYQYFSIREPNENHIQINNLEEAGHIKHLITQNVDGLHIKAGSRNLVELHGNSHRAFCLNCKKLVSRAKMQVWMKEINSNWHRPEDLIQSQDMAPDSDAVLTNEIIEGFQMCPCPYCGGDLKPDVVFFGDNVNYDIVTNCYQHVAETDALLVIGSSLEVWSGFRFAREAFKLGKEVMVLNIGETRADRFVEKNKDQNYNFTHLEIQSSKILKYATDQLEII